MSLKQPLKRRIVIAFFLMTLVVGGCSSISIFFIVQALEEHFVSQRLSEELDNILKHDMAREYILKLNKDAHFYTTQNEHYSIPKEFKHLKEGFSEILPLTGGSFYAYKQTKDNHQYLIIQDQEEFEAREQMLFMVVFIGFAGSLLASWLLGNILAHKIMAPVTKLASQVDHIKHQDIATPLQLSIQYADDEVGQLATAFDNAFGELQSSLERERLFTSDVSHELRTPLMVIATSCELLLENKDMSPKLYDQIDRISRANKDMYELVQTFLMLARAKSDFTVGGYETLSIVCEEQEKIWLPKFTEKNIQFSVDRTETYNKVYSAVLLKTVISNLLRNAFHYTDHGEVKLILEKNGFYVEDTGVGIPKDQQQLIFQAFAKASTTRGEGLGLGLSLVKRICTHQGWQVRVSSKPTGGSIFHVVLGK